MKKKFGLILAALIMCTGVAGGFSGCSGNSIEIVIDGGAVTGRYNSSISMTPSVANPNPYNTLEKLAEEYNKSHSGYTIKIARTSANGNRDTLLSYFSTSTGPDIIYQTGSTIAEDLGSGYFVDVSDELDKPNPYVQGNTRWADLYNAQELEASRAPDGSFYSIGIDRSVAGISYNKKIFEDAGIDFEINTFGDFMRAQSMIDTYSRANSLNLITYLPVDNWYNIVLEGNMYASTMQDIDVIRANGVLDTEELCRANSKSLYRLVNGNNPDPRFSAYLQLIEKATSYYPNVSGVSVYTEFINGKVAMMSSLGGDMVRAEQSSARKFEMGTFGYPYVTQADINQYTNVNSGSVVVTVPEVNGIRRGISGIGTGWWVTNSAMKKGTVETCLDFLKFITAPQNNSRMVNDMGYCLPLDPSYGQTGVRDLFKPMVTQYAQDTADGFKAWHTFNSWGILGFNYWSKFVTETTNLMTGQDVAVTARNLNGTFQNSVSDLIKKNGDSGAWDVEKW